MSSLPGSLRNATLIKDYFPEPLRLTVCGLFGALSVSDSFAVWLPVNQGANFTLMTQLAPAFSLAGAVPQVVLEML